jgi:hypothetical protein
MSHERVEVDVGAVYRDDGHGDEYVMRRVAVAS